MFRLTVIRSQYPSNIVRQTIRRQSPLVTPTRIAIAYSSYRTFSSVPIRMSFSNTNTGDKPADPYTQKNMDSPELSEKVNDLIAFVEKQKFCMMTTRIESSGMLVSRCMALAAKVQQAFYHSLTSMLIQA